MVCKNCGQGGGPSAIATPLSTVPASPLTCSGCSQLTSDCTCEENHIQNLVYKRYSYTLRTKTAFVWPAVNQSVTLSVDNVDRISIGSIIWHNTAGYLHVTGFDFDAQTITAKNQGETCNEYEGGETLPSCTEFVIGPPACTAGITPFPDIPFLAADFIAPAVSACALASVTSVSGLSQGDLLFVNGYRYTLGEIVDTDTIELCNDGDGAPVGTVFQWDADGDGIPNIPIIILSAANACLRTSVSSGIILVCDGANAARPLVGSATDQLPIWNSVTQTFELFQKGEEIWGGISTGSANAQAITIPGGDTVFGTGRLIAFTPGFTNTGAGTLSVNGTAAIAIRRPNGSSMLDGDLLAGTGLVVLLMKSGPLNSWILIGEPSKNRRTWTPTLGASGSMTFTGATVTEASYEVFGQLCIGLLNITSGTTGGTASTDITATIPPGLTLINSNAGDAAIIRNAGTQLIGKWITGSNSFIIRKSDSSNWALGSPTEFSLAFVLEVSW